MPLFLSEYIPRKEVLVKTVCPSRNGPNVGPELGMKIKDRQALLELVMKSVHRAMAGESPLNEQTNQRQSDQAYGRPSDQENKWPTERATEQASERGDERPSTSERSHGRARGHECESE
jgi:hypothetical protein